MDRRVWKKSWISPREEPRAHSNFTVEQPLSLADLSWICVLPFIGNGSSCGIMRWPSLKFHCIGKIMWHTWVALPGNRIKTIIFPLQLGLYVWVKCPLFLKGGSLLCNLGYVSIRCHNDQIMGGVFFGDNDLISHTENRHYFHPPDVPQLAGFIIISFSDSAAC